MQVRIRVRLVGGFAAPAVFDFLDAEPSVEYVVAMASNAVLDRHVEEAMEVARLCSGLTGQTEHVYGETCYAAKSWKHERSVGASYAKDMGRHRYLCSNCYREKGTRNRRITLHFSTDPERVHLRENPYFMRPWQETQQFRR